MKDYLTVISLLTFSSSFLVLLIKFRFKRLKVVTIKQAEIETQIQSEISFAASIEHRSSVKNQSENASDLEVK